jgi:formylglycine-generating enzyme required for sulfatase activity
MYFTIYIGGAMKKQFTIPILFIIFFFYSFLVSEPSAKEVAFEKINYLEKTVDSRLMVFSQAKGTSFTNNGVFSRDLTSKTIDIEIFNFPAQEDIVEKDIELIFIPPGEFTMGTPENESGRQRDESPLHKVTIKSPFYIGKFEVTQAQYESVMGTNPSKFKGNDLPVDSIKWCEAVEFCRKMSELTGRKYRLPTEAEWEYACRASTKTTFFWGNDFDDSYCWYRENSGGTSHPVGQKKPNAWGLYDMCGNIEEWCGDWYKESYKSKEYEIDPQGPSRGRLRVRRGGCWQHPIIPCLRSGNRFYFEPDERSNQIGFRIVREVKF